MSSEAAPLLLLAIASTAVAALCDLRTARIPNRLVGLFAALALGLRLVLAHDVQGALFSLAAGAGGALATACVPLLLYRMDGIGGGDVKLLAALGLALGPLPGLNVELCAFGLLLVYAPARLLYEGALLRTITATTALFVRPLLPASRRRPRSSEALTSFRFAPAIFVATLLYAVWPWGGV